MAVIQKTVSGLMALAILSGFAFWRDGFVALVSPAGKASARQPKSLVEALRAAEERTLEPSYIALLNMLCAQGLPGGGEVDISDVLRQLNDWAERVRAETERHLYRFRNAPVEFDGSEAYFRMLVMAVVLHEDFGVRYNPALISTPGTGSGQFFANSQDVFLHGLLGKQRLGTCSSMPVLYVAVGRRLGYPVFLVATKGHLFVRWEGRGERLNLEATGRGMNHYDDRHYREWPFALSDREIAENAYLKSMSPTEELAAFLSIRGACWEENGHHPEAMEAFEQAARLAPQCLLYRQLAAGQPAVIDAVSAYRLEPPPGAGGIGTETSGWSEGSVIIPDPNPLRTLSQQTY